MSKGKKEACHAMNLLYKSLTLLSSHFGCLRWQPASWRKEVSMVMVRKAEIEDISKLLLSMFWVCLEVETSVRQRLGLWILLGWLDKNQSCKIHNPNTASLQQQRAWLDWTKDICEKFSFAACSILIVETVTMLNTSTFRIHHKRNIQEKHQPNTFIPVEKHSCH